jgi:hypothetical protein
MLDAQPSLTYLAVINQLTNQPTDHGLLGKLPTFNHYSPAEEDKKEDEVSKVGRKERKGRNNGLGLIRIRTMTDYY